MRESGQKSPNANQQWTVLELLRWTTEHFATRGIESARLDAECLLSFALGVDRLTLYVDFEKPVSSEERGRFRELVRNRATERVPVSQLVGRKEFWSHGFKVSSAVLTPRPETELLIEQSLSWLPEPDASYRILDLGTGTGAIAFTLAQERPNACIVATDISPSALQIARENADELHLCETVQILEGDLFEPVVGERFDLVISNPPYLAERDRGALPPELAHEPELALFGGPDGLAVLRPLVVGVTEFLNPGGRFLVEVDPRQADEVASWCAEVGLKEVEILRDLARRPRAIGARGYA